MPSPERHPRVSQVTNFCVALLAAAVFESCSHIEALLLERVYSIPDVARGLAWGGRLAVVVLSREHCCNTYGRVTGYMTRCLRAAAREGREASCCFAPCVYPVYIAILSHKNVTR